MKWFLYMSILYLVFSVEKKSIFHKEATDSTIAVGGLFLLSGSGNFTAEAGTGNIQKKKKTVTIQIRNRITT